MIRTRMIRTGDCIFGCAKRNEGNMKRKKTLRMVQLSVLIAIVLIMTFTQLGYLRTAGLEVSLITIPVVIGAMIIGPGAGAALGLVFGLTSFYMCFGMSAFGAVLLGINPFLTFLVCVPTRTLMGFLTGVVFRGFHRIDKTKTVCYFAGGLLGAFFNTLFFMGMLIICFWNTDYIRDLNVSFGGLNPVLFAVAMSGINGLLELPAACLAGGAVSKALSRAFRNINNV